MLTNVQVTTDRPVEPSAPSAGPTPARTLPADGAQHPADDFDVFYRREYPRVVALAYALSGRRSAAEDLAQDAFLAAHQRWAQVREYDHPEAFVRRVLVNATISAGRRWAAEGRALRRLALRSRTSVEDLEPPDARFWEAVRRLPARQAQAIALYYLEERPADQIGAILGCSPATVAVHLHRGRAMLEKVLSKEVSGHGRS